MGHQFLPSNEKDYLLDYKEIIAIAPHLKELLTEEDSIEFSKELFALTKLIYEQYKNENEKLNA
jgi:hypothetical protein